MKYIWYIYLFLILSLGFARTAERIFSESGGFSSQYLPLIFSAILSFGVYGSIKKKPLFILWFWQALYWFSIILSLSLLAFALYLALVEGASSLKWSGVIVFSALLIIPAQCKIKAYSFKSPDIW